MHCSGNSNPDPDRSSDHEKKNQNLNENPVSLGKVAKTRASTSPLMHLVSGFLSCHSWPDGTVLVGFGTERIELVLGVLLRDTSFHICLVDGNVGLGSRGVGIEGVTSSWVRIKGRRWRGLTGDGDFGCEVGVGWGKSVGALSVLDRGEKGCIICRWLTGGNRPGDGETGVGLLIDGHDCGRLVLDGKALPFSSGCICRKFSR
jgi:hypothetical protein